MIEFRERKVQQINKTLWVSLPIEWYSHHNVSKGDVIQVSLGEGEVLVLRPKRKEDDRTE